MNKTIEFSTSGTLGDVFIVFCKLAGYHKQTDNRIRLHRYSRSPELDGPLNEFFKLIPYIEYVTPSNVIGSDINSIDDCRKLKEPHIVEFWDGNGRGNFTDDPEDVVFEPFPLIELPPAELYSGRIKLGFQLYSGKIGGNFKGFSLDWIKQIRDWLPQSDVDVYLFGMSGGYDKDKIEKICNKHSIINMVGKLNFIDWLRYIKSMDFFITPEGFPAFFAMSQKVKTLTFYTDYGMIGRIHPEWRNKNILLSAGWRSFSARILNKISIIVLRRYPLLRPIRPEIVYSIIHSNFSYRDGYELHSYWFGKKYWPWCHFWDNK